MKTIVNYDMKLLSLKVPVISSVSMYLPIMSEVLVSKFYVSSNTMLTYL